MLDHEPTAGGADPAGGDPTNDQHEPAGTADSGTRRRTRSRRKVANDTFDGESRKNLADGTEAGASPPEPGAPPGSAGEPAAGEKTTSRTRRRRSAPTKAQTDQAPDQPQAAGEPRPGDEPEPGVIPGQARSPSPAVLFMAPEEVPVAAVETGAAEPEPERGEAGRRRRSRRRGANEDTDGELAGVTDTSDTAEAAESRPAAGATDEADEEDGGSGRSRRRGRRGRGRGKGSQEAGAPEEPAGPAETATVEAAEPDDEAAGESSVTRRRRRRRRKGAASGEDESTTEDGVTTVVRVRTPRAAEDEVRGVSGSTRLEAKRQRRRGGRDQRRTRPPVLSESEFLARREAVDRIMVIRQNGPADITQIGVLEDGILVEHYVSRANSHSMVGSVYLGKVQNVLPSMEAAFVDVGRGRNAVLYAGEVNWDASGLEGRSRSIEQALSSGDSVLVQITKDPVGHKGARLTSNLALSGRHLVYTPYGNASGISRKLPENERRRLRDILKDLVPDGAGVIVRTAAESASADELARDVKRLQAQWEDIQAKAAQSSPPALLYSEPDLVVRVVRDLFNEDFRELVIEGEDAYETVEAYLSHVSPDLVPRLRRHTGTKDAFAAHRIDEQILKGLDRKVFLPSGGHLVFDRTEAMTVIDVNTGKYTGTGGNLEETVTRNNLEAAEEIVRQLRLRDIGGIIVIDFIDMVLESNRDLVLRRLTECLARDRTKHQVTEITSLGLVQMTRKRVGAGLLEVFSEPCEACKGRGVVVHTEPLNDRPRANQAAEKVKAVASASTGRRRGRRSGAARPPASDEETMGYDLSRYDDPGLPAPEAATQPVAPLEEPAGPGGEAGRMPPGRKAGARLAEPAASERISIEETGLSGVLRRFRRRR